MLEDSYSSKDNFYMKMYSITVEPRYNEPLYNELEKNIGRCGEVAVSGTSTVLATLNVPPASQPASRKGLDVLAGKTDSERHSEQSEAINLVPRSLVDESRRRCYSDVDTPAFWASSYP